MKSYPWCFAFNLETSLTVPSLMSLSFLNAYGGETLAGGAGIEDAQDRAPAHPCSILKEV